MYISVYFSDSGTPKTALAPKVTVYKVSDNSKVVDAQAMTEIAEGFYKYNFTTRDVSEAYVYICDSVTLTGADRYAVDDIAASTLGDVLEGTTTLLQAFRVILAAVAGKSTGFGSKDVYYRDVADSKNRIAASLDRKGNRTDITLDGS